MGSVPIEQTMSQPDSPHPNPSPEGEGLYGISLHSARLPRPFIGDGQPQQPRLLAPVSPLEAWLDGRRIMRLEPLVGGNRHHPFEPGIEHDGEIEFGAR